MRCRPFAIRLAAEADRGYRSLARGSGPQRHGGPMQFASLASAGRDRPLVPVLIVVSAFTIAALGAVPYAGSWNDGSRLAAVEAIADHGTLAIDDSVFVRVPADTIRRGVPP